MTPSRNSFRASLPILPALALPAVTLSVIVVAGGLGAATTQAVGLMPFVGPPTPSLTAFSTVVDDLPGAGLVSVALAAVSTLVAAVIGTAAAVAISSGGRTVGFLSKLTIPVPHLVGAVAFGLLLSDSGLLPRVLGLSRAQWPDFVAGRWWGATVGEYAWKESAFVALVVTSALATRVESYAETAALLGANRRQRFWFVTWPLARPALIAASAISFVYVLGSYEVPLLLGRSTPEPLAVLAVRLSTANQLVVRPSGSAVALITSALCLVVLTVAAIGLRRSLRRA